MKATVKLGNNVNLHIEETKEMETLHKAIVLSNPPKKCDVCGNAPMKMDSNKDKEGNVYVNVVCACGAKAKLGQYKVGGYFWHKFEVYKKSNNVVQEESVDTIHDDENEVPF